MEGGEGGEPGEDDGVDGCDEGPLPAAGLVADGDEGRDAREVQQNEDHVGKSTCRSDRLLESDRQ